MRPCGVSSAGSFLNLILARIRVLYIGQKHGFSDVFLRRGRTPLILVKLKRLVVPSILLERRGPYRVTALISLPVSVCTATGVFVYNLQRHHYLQRHKLDPDRPLRRQRREYRCAGDGGLRGARATPGPRGTRYAATVVQGSLIVGFEFAVRSVREAAVS